MKRTQILLADKVWKHLHIRSAQSGLSISELVRQAVQERYLGAAVQRASAMRAVVGIWRDRTDLKDVDSCVRKLRKGIRLGRLAPRYPS